MDVILAPVIWVWDLATKIYEFTGRAVSIIIGLVLLIVGLMLFLSIAGICLGVPFAIIGFLLVIRAFV